MKDLRRSKLKAALKMYMPASFALAALGIVVAVAGAVFGSRLIVDIGVFATLPFALPFVIGFTYIAAAMPTTWAFAAIEALPPFPGRRAVALFAAAVVLTVMSGLLVLLFLGGGADDSGSGIWYRGTPTD